METYYIYQHIRLDNEEVFYVGMGTKYESKFLKKSYRRAFTKNSRNFLWKRIVKKYGYKVEILYEFTDKNECLEKETELINFYGRILEGTGNLCNMVSCNEEIKKFFRQESAKASKLSRKKVYKYDLNGYFIEEYPSLGVAGTANNIQPSDIGDSIYGRKISAGGFMWRFVKTDVIPSYKTFLKQRAKKVDQYTLKGEYIKTWDSAGKAAKNIGVASSAIRNVLSGLTQSSGGYFWKYTNKDTEIPIINYRLEVYNLDMSFVGKYYSFAEAEKELNLSKNTISIYLQRRDKHFKYVFKDLKRGIYNIKQTA